MIGMFTPATIAPLIRMQLAGQAPDDIACGVADMVRAASSQMAAKYGSDSQGCHPAALDQIVLVFHQNSDAPEKHRITVDEFVRGLVFAMLHEFDLASIDEHDSIGQGEWIAARAFTGVRLP